MLYYKLVDPMGYRNDDPLPNTVNLPADTPDGSSHRPVLSTRGAETIQAAKPLHDAARGASPLTASSVHEVHEAYAIENTTFTSPRQADPETLPKSASFSNWVSTSTGASWKAEYTRLANEIQVRHYSPETLRTDTQWVRQFQTFWHLATNEHPKHGFNSHSGVGGNRGKIVSSSGFPPEACGNDSHLLGHCFLAMHLKRSRDPGLLSCSDVKGFLTFLAGTRKVSASTRNQTFNALPFFYRHVLNKEFGKLEWVVMAKRKPYIPVVLSREEIQAVVTHLVPPYDLVVKHLYGCGLRLFECLHPWVQAINFDAGILTVHDGKSQKDRTVPLPEKIIPELGGHLESLKNAPPSRPGPEPCGGVSGERVGEKICKGCQGVCTAMVFPGHAFDPCGEDFDYLVPFRYAFLSLFRRLS